MYTGACKCKSESVREGVSVESAASFAYKQNAYMDEFVSPLTKKRPVYKGVCDYKIASVGKDSFIEMCVNY